MVRVKTDMTLDEVKVKVCEQVGIDFSKNTLIMKLMYVDYDQPMDVLDDVVWLGYIDDVLRKEPVKLCVNAEPVIDDDHTGDMNQNAFDLNRQPHERNDKGIEDFTPELDDNRNLREHVVTTTLVSDPCENVNQPNATLGQQVIDITSEPYDWRSIVNMIRQPLHTPYNQQQSDSPSQNAHIHGTNQQFDCPPYSEQPIGSRREPVIEIGTSRHNFSQITHTLYNQQQFDRTSQNVHIHGTSQQVDYPPHFIPTPMQAALNIGGSFTSFLRSPLEQNPDIGHTFSMASINRNRGVHFRSDIPSSEIPPCPRVGAFQNEDSGLLFIGKKFRDKEDMKMKMSYHALKNDYMWKPVRSDKEKLKLRCFTSDSCEWKVIGRKVHGSNMFEITAYTETHTCGLERLTNDHRKARPGPIGRFVRENLIKLGSEFKTSHLILEVKRVFNIDLDYQRAYQCRLEALKLIGGSVPLSYYKLPAYFFMLEKENPGTVTDIDVCRVTGRFKYLSLKASIEGFKYCRPVLVVDGTHLKTKCEGTLLVAIGVDLGDHLFPVAFVVTDGESVDAWTYFMLHVRRVIGERADMVFVSDRGPGIINAVREVFLNAHRGFCYHRIVMNLNKKFRTTGYCPYTFWEAAYTFSKTRFQILFQQIKQQDKDPANRVSSYLEAIRFSHWARAHFPRKSYAIMTSNHVESFNNVIRDARKLSIMNLFDHIRATLQKWHCDRRELVLSCRMVSP